MKLFGLECFALTRWFADRAEKTFNLRDLQNLREPEVNDFTLNQN